MDETVKSQLSFYNRISELIVTAQDAESLSRALYKIIDGYIDVPHSALFLWDQKESKLKVFGSSGFTKEELVEVENTALERHPGWVFKNRKPLHIPDMDSDDVPSFISSSKRSFNVKSRLWVPITTTERSLGAFGFASQELNYFTEDHVNVLNFACRLAGNIYSNIIFSQSEKEYLNNMLVSFKKIKEASKTQQDFIAKMSHEIRTPLNGIIGMSKLIESTLLSKTQKKYVEIINNQSIQLLGLINDVLDISKVQSQNFKLVDFPFNLKEVLTSNIKSYEIQAKTKGLSFDYFFDSKIHNNLRGDSLRMSQIVNNLLSNAVKFTKNGHVAISVNDHNSTKEFQNIIIVVEDTGIGIGAAKLEKVFEGFHQEDDSIVRKYGGTGLGLMITKEIVDLMNGDVLVESEKGKGSRFTVKLRIKKSDRNTNKNMILRDVSLNGLKVLIAEDNEVNSFYLKTLLEQEGSIVSMAVNGKEVVDLCKKETFDLILMDIQMPVMDGITATKIIRDELKLNTPIIAQTANTVQKDIDACFEAGVLDFISKPFTSSELNRKISLNLNLDLSNNKSKNTTSQSLYSNVLNLVNGDKEFAIKIINVFGEDTPKNLMLLKKAFSAKDEVQINKIGHKIKSSFRMFKLKVPFELSLWIEKFSSKNQTWNELEEHISLLDKECSKYLNESI
ncbi:ATP-binding protein [Crocinitomicaceae bacterium]|nr:ATP-binding protein [Crocinitomicaceae bacterium]